MAGIAIIANPNARRNREWPLAAGLLRKAAPAARIHETRTEAELAAVTRALAADPPRVVAIAGGDGTVTHTVTALAQAFSGRELPPLSLLGGGAYDSLAPLGGRGGAEDRLRKLADALASGSELMSEQRDTLHVRADGQSRCGFRFGVGLPVRFVDAIYRSGASGPWSSAKVLVRALSSSVTHGRFARNLFGRIDLRVRLDDEEWPPVPTYGVVCSSVAEAGLGLRPFRRATEQPGAFEALGLTAGPRRFALELGRLITGGNARRDRLIDGVGERMELSGKPPMRWLLDGEIFVSEEGRVEVTLGPRVTLVRA
jgi:diacylglycerol kinase family enzyme